jgi:hypothetical protein
MKSFRHYLTALDRLATARTHQIGRKKLYRALLATTVVAGSQLLGAFVATANSVPTPAQPDPLLPTRVLLNGSFESPIVTPWHEGRSSSTTGNTDTPTVGVDTSTDNIAGGNIREGYKESAYNSINYSKTVDPIVWQTTETSGTRSQYGYSDAVEVWRGTPGGVQSASGVGKQFAEINGSDNAALYQDLCVIPNETINWSLLHAARQKSTNPTNIMQVSITDPTLWGSGSKTPALNQAGAYYSSLGSYPTTLTPRGTADPITTNRPFIATTYNDGWKPYSGAWTNTTYSNPKLLRFAFRAVLGSDGSITYGNFIDDVKLSLPALIDFLPSDPDRNVNVATTTEGNTTNYYYLSLRINGKTAAGKVTIALTGLNQSRSFRLGTVKKGNTIVTGLSATKDGNSIKLDLPAGTYDPNSPSDYIHIPIDFSDTTSQPNDNLLFTLQSVNLGDLTIKSTQCSTTDRITVETKLIDDDYQKRVELPGALPFKIAAH